MRTIIALLITCLLATCTASVPAYAFTWRDSHVDFCNQFPDDCVPSVPTDLLIDDEVYEKLKTINEQVNVTIEEASDFDVYGVYEKWTIPVTRGDCDDIALLKRRLAIKAGLPPSAMRLAVGITKGGIGHVVLLAIGTNRILSLDNLFTGLVTAEHSLSTIGYVQAEDDPRTWVKFEGF